MTIRKEGVSNAICSGFSGGLSYNLEIPSDTQELDIEVHEGDFHILTKKDDDTRAVTGYLVNALGLDFEISADLMYLTSGPLLDTAKQEHQEGENTLRFHSTIMAVLNNVKELMRSLLIEMNSEKQRNIEERILKQISRLNINYENAPVINLNRHVPVFFPTKDDVVMTCFEDNMDLSQKYMLGNAYLWFELKGKSRLIYASPTSYFYTNEDYGYIVKDNEIIPVNISGSEYLPDLSVNAKMVEALNSVLVKTKDLTVNSTYQDIVKLGLNTYEFFILSELAIFTYPEMGSMNLRFFREFIELKDRLLKNPNYASEENSEDLLKLSKCVLIVKRNWSDWFNNHKEFRIVKGAIDENFVKLEDRWDMSKSVDRQLVPVLEECLAIYRARAEKLYRHVHRPLYEALSKYGMLTVK